MAKEIELSIFRGSLKDLMKRIEVAIASKDQAYELMHVACVSAIFHAAEHGQVAPLNAFYLGLNVNDRMSVKQYLRRTQMRRTVEKPLNPDGSGTWLTFESEKNTDERLLLGSFSVNTKKMDERKKWMALATDKLIACPAKPEGTPEWVRFYQRENIAEAIALRTFTDANVVALIKGIVKRIKDGDTDTTKVVVSDRMLKFVEGMEETALATLGRETKAPAKVNQPTADKAMPAAEQQAA